jgi:hypothetical protein
MQTIFYGNARFDTDDAVAVAVLDYAEKLAVDGSCAVVRIPTVSEGMPSTSRLLIGTGLPVAVQAGTRARRVDDYDAEVDPFEVRRTLHDISERMGFLRQKVVARSFSPDTTLDEIWELAFEDDDAIGEPTPRRSSPATSTEHLAPADVRARETGANVTAMTPPAADHENWATDDDTADGGTAREDSSDFEV